MSILEGLEGRSEESEGEIRDCHLKCEMVGVSMLGVEK